MDLTIVIVNWNGGHLLMRCLESIRAKITSSGFAVIVVDNDSSDGSREAATEAFPEFQVVNSGGNLGFGRANNLVRGLINTPLVLFLNPDTELMDGTLDRAVQCLDQHPDVGALGCRMLDPGGKVQELGLQWPMTLGTSLFEFLFIGGPVRERLRSWLPTIDPLHSGYVRKLYGGFLMVRKNVMDAAGWFDERYFMYAEDADLSRTIIALGWKLYYCSEAMFIHVGGGITARTPSEFSVLMQLESIRKLIEKYQGKIAAGLYRAGVLAPGFLRLIVALVARLRTLSTGDEVAAARWRASCVKHQCMVLWSLGLKRPNVPAWPSARQGH